MSFKDAVEQDNHAVFLNLEEFARELDIWVDGVVHPAVPAVLSGLKENDRKRLTSGVKEQGGRNSVADRVEGLYSEAIVLHCALSALGRQPNDGARFRIRETGKTTWREYYVTASVSDMGMLRVELAGLAE